MCLTTTCWSRLFIAIATLIALPSASAADHFRRGETLICREDASQGFLWDEAAEASVTEFMPESYKVKIVSDSIRHIAQPGLGYRLFTCAPIREARADISRCFWEGTVFLFREHAFVTAFLFGEPVGGGPNVAIAYGTCEQEE